MSLEAKEERVEKPHKGANAGLGGGAPQVCGGDLVCFYLDARHTADSQYLSTYSFTRY